jgi:hypothetical protein
LLGESLVTREYKTIFINDINCKRYDERIQKKPDKCIGSGVGSCNGSTGYNELSELDALRLARVKSKELRVKSMWMSIPKRREERAPSTPNGIHVPHGSPAFSGEGVKKFAIFGVKSRTPVQTERSGVRLGGLAENHEF